MSDKPCDDLSGTCDQYPACVCGRAWKAHEAKLRKLTLKPERKRGMTPQNSELIEGTAKVMGYKFLAHDRYTNEAVCQNEEKGTFVFAPMKDAFQREEVLDRIGATVDYNLSRITVETKVSFTMQFHWPKGDKEEFGRAVCRAAIAWGEG